MKKKEKEKGEKRRGDEEKRRKKKNKNRESSARDEPLSPDAFPSRKLGNNMTPIEGRLGKNTTPTCRRTAALTPNLQKDPQQRQLDFDDSSHPDSGYASKKVKYKKHKPHSNEALFIRKSKPSETRANVPNSPSISIKDVRTFSRKSEVEWPPIRALPSSSHGRALHNSMQ